MRTANFGLTQNSGGTAKRKVMGPDFGSVNEQVNKVSRRLRVLEERYSNLQRKDLVSDQNMLRSHKKIHTELRSVNMEISDLKKDLKEIKETVGLIVRELRNCARREEVRVLEKYLNLWQPVKFVSQNQVVKIVKQMIEEQK